MHSYAAVATVLAQKPDLAFRRLQCNNTLAKALIVASIVLIVRVRSWRPTAKYNRCGYPVVLTPTAGKLDNQCLARSLTNATQWVNCAAEAACAQEDARDRHAEAARARDDTRDRQAAVLAGGAKQAAVMACKKEVEEARQEWLLSAGLAAQNVQGLGKDSAPAILCTCLGQH